MTWDVNKHLFSHEIAQFYPVAQYSRFKVELSYLPSLLSFVWIVARERAIVWAGHAGVVWAAHDPCILHCVNRPCVVRFTHSLTSRVTLHLLSLCLSPNTQHALSTSKQKHKTHWQSIHTRTHLSRNFAQTHEQSYISPCNLCISDQAPY